MPLARVLRTTCRTVFIYTLANVLLLHVDVELILTCRDIHTPCSHCIRYMRKDRRALESFLVLMSAMLRTVATPSISKSPDFTLLWSHGYLASMCFILPTPCRFAKAWQLEESEKILATTSFVVRKFQRRAT